MHKKRKSKHLELDKEPKAVTEMKREARREETKKKIKSKKKKVIFIIIILVVLSLAISLGISTHKWKTIVKDMAINQPSIVKDIQGNEIAKLGSEKKKKTISEIPNNLKNAYVAIEDERYYKHHGVDVKRTASAVGSYIIHFGSSSFGGSTITQQLVKNLTGDSTDSITRKVKEWWKAWQVETCLSKEEILTLYLNSIYVGPSIYGVEAGSQYYFSKSAENLSVEECAFIAGINHSPNSYNPFSGKDNSEKIKKRTKIVLSKMKELGYIKSDEEYNQAVQNVDNGLKFSQGNVSTDTNIYSYHTDALISSVTSDICKKYNINEEFASNYLSMAGLTINSTQDSKIQGEMEKECEKKKYILASKNGTDTSQSAMVIIDHKTGNVLRLCWWAW